MLTPETLPDLQRALADANLDGWLLFDFQGLNPIAAGALALDGFVTRRVFGWIPREGVPVAVTHDIEQGPWHRWPKQWKRVRYSSWKVLEQTLASMVKGKRVAMEYSPGDAVPYLDRVPGGVLEMVRAAGAEIVSSGTLVSRFYAMWTDVQLASHKRAAQDRRRDRARGVRGGGEAESHDRSDHRVRAAAVDREAVSAMRGSSSSTTRSSP